MTIAQLLRSVTSSLESKGIPYMVSGSMAMIAYTVARTTRDIDMVIELNIESVDDFCELFKEHFYLHKPSIEEEVRKRGMFNLIDERSGMKIDFIVKKNSPYRKHEFERKNITELFGHQVWVVSVEDLIISKLIWIQELQSGRQMEDIKMLLANQTVDRVYIKKWINDLGLTTFDLI
ncbi:MAG TPA: nucleotidyl transferase AbiEii/AbiGii toxin family protein [Cyclobacteriaceae bacterium]|nr:nucleotidyl transferase AbiEii/AbiGii toxin family protein [Cyclobacteriaceae bacterium]